jgi:glucose/arabinose dehydrogenase
MLRLDVDAASPASPVDGRAYGIPADNPFVGQAGIPPETWALGLRNPWRFSFAPDGRMVLADVGQNAWEEVDIVSAGDNLGWKIREGSRCFAPTDGCATDGLVDPVYTYGHEQDGQSITGGYVYTGQAIPALAGKYVFGDFVSGRIWALDLPAELPGEATVHALGRFPAMWVTFGRDGAGELWVADFAAGVVYGLEAGGA